MRKLVHIFMIVTLTVGLLITHIAPTTLVYADTEDDWDLIDEDFTDYAAGGWTINKGSNSTEGTGSVIQGDGEVTIIDTQEANNYAWRYLVYTGFTLVDSGFTFEFRAKVNAPGTVNGAGVRTNGKLIPLFLTFDGESGAVQNAMTEPIQSYELDTSQFTVYRVVVDENFNYDVYVDDQYAWSGNWVGQSGGNLVKLGAESPVSANMTIDYFKLSSKILPPSGDAVDKSELSNIVTEAEILLGNVDIGGDPGQYTPAAVDRLSAAIEDAREVLGLNNLTQSQVNEAVASLRRQIVDFKRSIVPSPIDPSPPNFPVFHYEKVVIDPEEMRYNPTGEYDFPTVIKASDYFAEPLGTYYMYYGPHDAPGGISLAYADSLDGEWTEYEHNPIISRSWDPHYRVSHVASAHPIWIEDEQKLFMYFHGENSTTRLASSTDGIHFDYEKIVVTTADFHEVSEASYARVFEYTIPNLDNKYIMLLMGNNKESRKIYLAWSNDGREWETQRMPIISPINDGEINHRSNLSGAWYFPWEGRHFVSFHAGSGHQYMVEVGEYFNQEVHYDAVYRSSAGAPEHARAASRTFIQEDDTIYMFYEAGQRGSTKIALAKSVSEDDLQKLHTVNLTVQNNILQLDQVAHMDIIAKRYNGELIDLDDASVQYFSSDHTIVSVDDGRIRALQVGEAEVWVEVTLDGTSLQSNKLLIKVREGEVWDVIDEDFDDYVESGWLVNAGRNVTDETGSITQGDGFVTIVEDREASNYSWRYLTRTEFHVPGDEYTFEVRAKVNEAGTVNVIGTRVNGKAANVILTYDGEQGSVQNDLSKPSRTYSVNTNEYQVYRIVVHRDSSFDVYVNGVHAWSDTLLGGQSTSNLVKLGGESPVRANLDVDYFKLNTGTLLPETELPDPEPGPDMEAPSVPQNVTGTADSSSAITLTWDASTDNVGVTGYRVYRYSEDTAMVTVTDTTYTDTGLQAATRYTYQVSAIDAAGNESGLSDAIEVVTLGLSEPRPEPDPEPVRPRRPSSSRPAPPAPAPAEPEHKMKEEGGTLWLEANDEKVSLDARNVQGNVITFDLSDVELTVGVQTIGIQLSRNAFNTIADQGKGIELVADGLRLVIPAGSLTVGGGSDDVKVIIRNAGYANSFDGYTPVTTTFDVTMVSGEQDVTLSGVVFVEYKLGDVNNPNLVSVYYHNEDTGQWEYFGGMYHATSHTMSFEAKHPSAQYAVFEFTKRFNDIADTHWAHEAIYELASKQIIFGTGKDTFEPDVEVTRAEFVALLSRMLGIDAASDPNPFADVAEDAWYADLLAAAYEIGIIEGDGVNIYPDEVIKREEMAAMAMRAYKQLYDHQDQANAQTNFHDDQHISNWAKESVVQAIQLGLMQGKPQNMFDPQGHATRAEAAMIIYRIMTN